MSFIDKQRMPDTATAFFLAGERRAPDLAFGAYGMHSVSAPRLMSYAFAVEVALRLILHLKPDLVSIYEQNWGRFEPDRFYAWPKLEVTQIEAGLK